MAVFTMLYDLHRKEPVMTVNSAIPPESYVCSSVVHALPISLCCAVCIIIASDITYKVLLFPGALSIFPVSYWQIEISIAN